MVSTAYLFRADTPPEPPALECCRWPPAAEQQDEIVHPKNVVELTAIPELFDNALRLEASIVRRHRALVRGIVAEGGEIVNELITRFGDARRKYMWEKWLEDSPRPPWAMSVFYRLFGRPHMGNLRSVVDEALKELRRDDVRLVPGDGATQGDDAEEGLFASIAGNDGVDTREAACSELLGHRPTLVEEAIIACAAAGAFGPFGESAVDVYRTLHQRGTRAQDAAIARKHKVPEDLVTRLRDPGFILKCMQSACPQLLNEMARAVDLLENRAKQGFPRTNPLAATVPARVSAVDRADDEGGARALPEPDDRAAPDDEPDAEAQRADA